MILRAIVKSNLRYLIIQYLGYKISANILHQCCKLARLLLPKNQIINVNYWSLLSKNKH